MTSVPISSVTSIAHISEMTSGPPVTSNALSHRKFVAIYHRWFDFREQLYIPFRIWLKGLLFGENSCRSKRNWNAQLDSWWSSITQWHGMAWHTYAKILLRNAVHRITYDIMYRMKMRHMYCYICMVPQYPQYPQYIIWIWRINLKLIAYIFYVQLIKPAMVW